MEDGLNGEGSVPLRTRQPPSPFAQTKNASDLPFAGYQPGLRTSLSEQRGFTSEADRVAALTALNTFCKPPEPEPRFDSITKLMAAVFKTPISIVSLVGEHSVEAKYAYGAFPSGTCVDRSDSVCTSILKPDAPEMLVVEDLSQDARFASNPFVRDNPHLRFYAGAPLVGSGGMRYGTLCTLDTQPRHFPASLLNTLVNFAELATRELERDKEIEATTPRARRLRKPRAYKEPVALVDMQSTGWKLLWNNPAWGETTGVSAEEVDVFNDSESRSSAGAGAQEVTFWGIFNADHGAGCTPLSEIQPALAAKKPVRLVVRRSSGSSNEQVSVVLRPFSDTLAADVQVGIPAFSSSKLPVDIELGGHSVSPWFAIIETDRTISTRSSYSYSSQSSTPRAAESPRSPVYPPPQFQPPAILGPCAQPEPAPYGLAVPERYQGLVLGPLVGAGSYGRVHRALWKDSPVAVKVIDIETDSTEADLRAMLAEALLHPSILNHPNIVRVLDYCHTKAHSSSYQYGAVERCDSVWIVLDYCDRGRLGDAVSRGWLAHPTPDGTFVPDLRTVLRTAADIASALVHLHGYGVVHCDLACSNILLASNESDPRGWVAKISDFGQSCVLKDGPRKTRRHGTLIYMPPELLGEGILTLAADVYSLGICMWEMYTGCRAWGGQHPAEVIMSVCEGEGHLPLPPSAPVGFKNLVEGCMAADRLLRPTAKEVLTLIMGLLQTC